MNIFFRKYPPHVPKLLFADLSRSSSWCDHSRKKYNQQKTLTYSEINNPYARTYMYTRPLITGALWNAFEIIFIRQLHQLESFSARSADIYITEKTTTTALHYTTTNATLQRYYFYLYRISFMRAICLPAPTGSIGIVVETFVCGIFAIYGWLYTR